ncbi:hypothetical protein [Deinococcus depolymerans]|uniref:Uncharacterized protein n=1 Tax=Deinococcus depolymerans TaxID=392408 RepID=A0ABN1BQS1_9DEIO
MDSINARLEALNHAVRSLGKPITNGGQRMNLIECVWSGLEAPADKELEDIHSMQLILHQVILAIYREVKKKDPDVAFWMIRSYMIDHPDYPGSNLFSKIASVMEASLALRKNSTTADNKTSGDRNTSFLISKEAYRSGVEFISSWMGWMTPLVQVFNGDSPDWRILKKPAATKIEEFEKQSKGKDGVFSILFNLISKDLRNSIAHSDIQLDSYNGNVIYRNIKSGTENSIPLIEFMTPILVMSYLPSIYVGALSAILVMEFGRTEDKLKLPVLSVEAFSGVKIVSK